MTLALYFNLNEYLLAKHHIEFLLPCDSAVDYSLIS